MVLLCECGRSLTEHLGQNGYSKLLVEIVFHTFLCIPVTIFFSSGNASAFIHFGGGASFYLVLALGHPSLGFLASGGSGATKP